jgi:hypothetical protein
VLDQKGVRNKASMLFNIVVVEIHGGASFSFATRLMQRWAVRRHLSVCPEETSSYVRYKHDAIVLSRWQYIYNPHGSVTRLNVVSLDDANRSIIDGLSTRDHPAGNI